MSVKPSARLTAQGIRVVLLVAVAGLVISAVRSQAVAATAYVVNGGSGSVTPINTSTNAAGPRSPSAGVPTR